MLAVVTHVRRAKKNSYVMSMYRKNYFFIVDPSIEEKIEVGMLARSTDGQLVYVKELLLDSEKEALYTGVLTKVKEAKIIVRSNENNNLQKRNPIEEASVFKGHVVVIENKRFKKMPTVLKIKTNKVSYELIHIGDVINVEIRRKNAEPSYQLVLVEEIVNKIKKKPKPEDRIIKDYFYQKTPKGYKKIRVTDDLKIKKIKIKNKPID